jgi:transcriptional antiterminator RfaH
MPILKREPDLWPGELFEPSPAILPWQVAYVRSRQEKNLVRLLRGRMPFYLPQWEQVRRRGGRSFSSWLPLFSGYVFLRGSRNDRRLALSSNLVVSFIEVPDQQRLHDELGQLHRLQSEGGILEPWPQLVVGDEVVIRQGPFDGYRGVIVRERGRTRLIVSVSTLARSIAVELGRESIRPLAERESRQLSDGI